MNPKMKIQWLAVFVLAALAVGYAAYESRAPGFCAGRYDKTCLPRALDLLTP